MVRSKKCFTLLALTALMAGVCLDNVAAQSVEEKARSFVTQTLQAADRSNPYDAILPLLTELIEVKEEPGKVELVFNNRLGFRPWDPDSAAELTKQLRAALGLPESTQLAITLRYTIGRDSTRDYSFESHVTSMASIQQKAEDGEPKERLSNPVAHNADRPGPAPSKGIPNSNIVIGSSHGWTWHQENRWQFQRARLFTMVEDLYPMAYINPFIIPMLENAGATVFSARERDHQFAEVIVDNDEQSAGSEIMQVGTWETAEGNGWRGGVPAFLAPDTEPFTLGTTQRALVNAEEVSSIIYMPYIPRDGHYAVYVSWAQAADNSEAAVLEVRHAGGRTRYTVNQQVAGNTWIYLGHHYFKQGKDGESAAITITSSDAKVNTGADGEELPTYVSVDAVRFGGGMGNAAPGGHTSGQPRYTEAARYHLQYSGAPKEEVYHRPSTEAHFGPDYWRDIIARAEWTNYLNGAPSGPNGSRDLPGLGVPIDLYLSFHTDAGIDKEGIYGTLNLYTINDDTGSDTFPDGRSRLLNRHLTSLMQEEIVRTARSLYTSTWERRALQDRNLGEIRRPNVPSTLLELLSHQNFNDMKYGLDPRFKHDMARAISKSIVRFIAYQEGYEPVIQPLQVTHLSAIHQGQGNVKVSWRPQPDPLEPSAIPSGYIVYSSTDGLGFDNGVYTEEATTTISGLLDGDSRYFRVVAINEGGASLPSRLVGVRRRDTSKTLLLVDGFDRVSGPEIIEAGTARGFDRSQDPGVAWHYNFELVGDMYDFNPESQWKNDLEGTGWGASNSNWEGRLEVGNHFNHIATHGAVMAALDLGFDSMTADAFTDGNDRLAYGAINWIAGRQKTINPPKGLPAQGNPDRMKPEFPVLTDKAIARLEQYLADTGKFMISGAHIAEDMMTRSLSTPRTEAFATEILGLRDFAKSTTTTNSVSGAELAPELFEGLQTFRYGTDLEYPINMLLPIYAVPSSEAYDVSLPGSRVGLNYADTKEGASIHTDSTVVVGFPLETVLPMDSRVLLTRRLLESLGVDIPDAPSAQAAQGNGGRRVRQ